MKVDIWSDYACPFCYIGEKRLEKAIEESGVDVEIAFRSFQLDPTIEEGVGINAIDSLAKKYGMSEDKVKNMVAQMLEMAKSDGLNYDFDNLIETNTLRAHRLMHYGKTMGKDVALNEKLFIAHFIDAKHIGEIDELVKIGVEVGLDEVEVKKVLESDMFLEEVNEDLVKAREYGIGTVPFFIFNDKYTMQGAQDVQMFIQALKGDGDFE